MPSVVMKKKYLHRFFLLALLPLSLVACKSASRQITVSDYQLMTVDESYTQDSIAEATIAPYREQLSESMDKIIGNARMQLSEKEVESLLGNFVADAILEQSRLHYFGDIHLSVINNGGLRAPIPAGPVTVASIYELMPFENILYIVEMDGSLTQQLFNKLARDKRLAVSNSVVVIREDKPIKIFIDGEPFKSDQKYVLAVSDYLANGGGGMEFLKQAKVLEKIDIKIRDLIIDQIKLLGSNGVPIEAEIEGRVMLVP